MSKSPKLLIVALFTLLVCSLASGQKANPKRPNIIVILADDMGFSDIGSFGSEIPTPNIDKLAAGGIRFTQFYNNTRCSPSRAALLTGLYSHQTGVAETPDSALFPEGYLRHLSPNAVTIPEVLRMNGYHTLMSGKWHLGKDRPHWPVDRGFEKSFALIDCCSNYFGQDYHRSDSGDGGRPPTGRSLLAMNDKPDVPPAEGLYLTDAFGNQAANFIQEYGARDKPFFLYLAFTAPHWPLQALPEDIAKYKGKYLEGWEKIRERRHRRLIDLGIVAPRWPLSPMNDLAFDWDQLTAEEKEKWDLLMAVYAAMIDRMDQNIGKVLAELKKTGQEENTLILFLSDNGASAEGVNRGKPGASPGTKESYRGYGLPWANVSSTPFRLFKQFVHEGGITTPMIAYWPQVIKKKNSLFHQPTHMIDVMATALDAVGARYPQSYNGNKIIPLEGKSLMPAFKGRNAPVHTELYWEHRGHRAVRQGKWKLVQQSPAPWELYDLEADRTEMNDLAAKNPRKVKELSELYDKWAARSKVIPYPFKPYVLKGQPKTFAF